MVGRLGSWAYPESLERISSQNVPRQVKAEPTSTTNQPLTELDDGEQSGNWTIFKNELTPSAYLEVLFNASTLLCDIIHLSVMWENEYTFNSSQKLCQGGPAKHSPFIIVSVVMSHHFIILKVNHCPSSSSSYSHLHVSNVSHFDLVYQSRKKRFELQLRLMNGGKFYKVPPEGNLEIFN